jgi:hypothetical protein
MDYIMRYLKKISNQLTLFCLVLFSIYSYAGDKKIETNNIKLDFKGGHYYLSYSQSIQLLSEPRKALSKGIPFHFLVTATISQENKYGFSNHRLSKEFHFQLKYKSLLQKYMVSDINGQKSYFKDIDGALEKLSSIEKWNIGPSSYLEEGTLELKTKLDKKFLPKALQINFNDKTWDVESEIKKYEIGKLN